jgi:pilus assembly protein Flp/PilA
MADTRSESGASAVEYGLLIVAIAAVIVVVIFALGGVVRGLFSKTCSTISGQASAGGDCTS